MKKGDELVLEITGLSSEGYGIGRIDNFVVFVENTLPGDIVKTQILRKKHSYAKAKTLEFIEKSENRIAPECEYFGTCGGCKIQNYKYEKQIEHKTQTVKDAFSKIGKFDLSNIEIPPALQSKNIFHYRNKTEFSFSTDKWYDVPPPKGTKDFVLGFHVPGFYTKIVDINKCFLQANVADDIVNFTRDFFTYKGETIYDSKTDSGYLRFLVIRKCENNNDLLVNLVTFDFNEELIAEFTDRLIKQIPSITSVVNSVTRRKAHVAVGEEAKVYFGKGTILEKLNNGRKDLLFKISPNSFFQTNTKQAELLYSTGESFLDLNPEDKLLDLYCGAGAITLFVSDKVNSAFGVELIEDAVMNAKENAELNNITNCDFFTADIKDFLKSQNKELNFNKLVLDPPRSGLHPDISEILSDSSFEKILYISCNPSTQARDIATICSKGKYIISKVQPVDMFPHTYHVENICLLEMAK